MSCAQDLQGEESPSGGSDGVRAVVDVESADRSVVVPSALRPAGSCTRGTSNGNSNGNSTDRRRRREWLVETYRANVDVPDFPGASVYGAPVALGFGVPACRCYRCGLLLTVDTVTVDRIIPGCLGGTYRRNNIRPACGPCNSETGGALAHLPKKRGKR